MHGRDEEPMLVVVQQELVRPTARLPRQRATMKRAYHSGQSGSGSPRSVS